MRSRGSHFFDCVLGVAAEPALVDAQTGEESSAQPTSVSDKPPLSRSTIFFAAVIRRLPDCAPVPDIIQYYY